MLHSDSFLRHIEARLEQNGLTLNLRSITADSGGCINQGFRVRDNNGQSYFVKRNQPHLIEMFKAEYLALEQMQQISQLAIPKPLAFGKTIEHSFIIMSYLPLQSSGDESELAQGIAQMHKIVEKNYGWQYNNTIGSTPQSNHQHSNWLDFWIQQRLNPQLKRLAQNGYHQGLLECADKLYIRVEQMLSEHQPPASMCHGDLWSGNVAYVQNGQAAIFDPALYYGDRETDLAMTELFGGFSQRFYTAYNEVFPIENEYRERKILYNLYHILNHANLFGGSYISQAQNIIKQLL